MVPALTALQVSVFVGKGQDFSDSGIGDLADLLQNKTRAAIAQKLGAGFLVHDDAGKKSFGASPLVIRSIKQRADGPNTFVDVKCELTLVDMPQNILRAALATTASVGVAGPVGKKLENELAHDAVNACAPELADDFVAYVKEHSRR